MPSPATSPLRTLVAANLDQAISESGKTNRAIGEAIGSTEHQVWRWRRGKALPSSDYLARLADQLFGGDLSRLYAESSEEAAA